MLENRPRGIVVVDVGYTNTKAILFSSDLKIVAERKMPSSHRNGPDYRVIDAEPVFAFLKSALPELDSILPIDTIVPCAHGACIVNLDNAGELVFPIMDYVSEPPPEIIVEFRKHQPNFSEVFCPLLPMALTHAMQLFWLQKHDEEKFARVKMILPWMQYIALILSGVAATEISSMACQSMLINVTTGAPSSLAKAYGWDKKFPQRKPAWQVLGKLKPAFAGAEFRGDGNVLTGIHDSNANYLRYLAAGRKSFTLLSTGTWVISFNNSADITKLDHTKDTNTNTDIFGNVVACSRFFGGKEMEVLSQGAAPEFASLQSVQTIVNRQIFALPAFSDSGGPIPYVGGNGKITGPFVDTKIDRASLAALYCALMVSSQLDAVASKNDIIVDGPFAKHSIFLSLLAQLRPHQKVSASDLRDGTAAGAACLALISQNQLPEIGIALNEAIPSQILGLKSYAERWLEEATK